MRPPNPANTLPRSQSMFHHPSYDDMLSCFLDLAHTDTQDSVSYGIRHRTALTACQIIAANRFEEGYLSLNPTGPPIEVPIDVVLTEERYYFVIDGCLGMCSLHLTYT